MASTYPTFAIVRSTIDNTQANMSSYGYSMFTNIVDAIHTSNLCYDTMMSEINNGKMHVFLPDVIFDIEPDSKTFSNLLDPIHLNCYDLY